MPQHRSPATPRPRAPIPPWPSTSGTRPTAGPGWTAPRTMSAWTGTGYRLVLAVPIIPTNSSGTAQGTLAEGATGAYNQYFTTLGREPRQRQRGQRHLASGVGVQRQLVPLVGGIDDRRRRTSSPTGARSSPPCGPCPGSNSSSSGTPTGPAPRRTRPTQAYPGQRLRGLRRHRRLRQLLGHPLHPGDGLDPPADRAVGSGLVGRVRGRTQQAHRHPRVVRRVPHRRSRPRRRPLVRRQHGRLVRLQQRGLRRRLVVRHARSPTGTTSSTAPSPRRWRGSRPTSADNLGPSCPGASRGRLNARRAWLEGPAEPSRGNSPRDTR